MGAHETAVHQLGLAAETIAELKRQLSATEERYQRVSDLAVNLTATLRSIANANYREWEELATPDEFVKWAQSIARAAVSSVLPSDRSASSGSDRAILHGLSILDYVGKFLPRETLVASQGLQAADCSTSSCAHEPLLELDGKKIVGSHRCKHCGLNKSYWNAREL